LAATTGMIVLRPRQAGYLGQKSNGKER